jgi:parvulin-like peptidyl-prolyl isomerase
VATGADEKAVEQRRRLATRVLEEARGGRDFAELAKTYSDDESTKNDAGDLGWVTAGEGLPENLSDVIFAMELKEVRGPVRTERGFEVVQVVERKEGDVKPFAEVRESIRNQLYAQQMEKQTQSWLADLRRKAHVDVRL